jgi:adenylosuccinate synthase
MPVTVVAGGQFGSEGKGKVAHSLAKEMGAAAAVRVGGPNSGHTVVDDNGNQIIFRQLPTAAILPDIHCILPAGSYVRLDVLLREIEVAHLSPDRLSIDPNAIVITDRQVAEENASNLYATIGSTLTGTGAAVKARIERSSGVTLAQQDEALQRYVRPTTPFLRSVLQRNERVVIEGTQGFGLSVLHSMHYPFVTSRDTTAAGFVSEAGLSPLDVDDIVLVLRAFPIRVSGNSGPMFKEISWSEVTSESGSPTQLTEYTSVTRRLRRVARFDSEMVRRAVLYQRPTRIVLNHVDHVDAECARFGVLTAKALTFVHKVESDIGGKISFVGWGPADLSSLASSTQRLRRVRST